MEPSQPPRRKRSYSTTAYSSQEEEAALGHVNMNASISANTSGSSSSNVQPTCLLAAAVGPHVISYEFINTGTVLPTAAPAGAKHQPPIAVPGQYEGIQMSNEFTGYTTASLKWSPDSMFIYVVYSVFATRIRLSQLTISLLFVLIQQTQYWRSKHWMAGHYCMTTEGVSRKHSLPRSLRR